MEKIKFYFGGIILVAIGIMYFLGAAEFGRELRKDSDLSTPCVFRAYKELLAIFV
jgi:hypothetical protein